MLGPMFLRDGLVYAFVATQIACSSDATDTPPESEPLTGARAVLLGDALANIAHAGGKGLRPEHTMIAYENALAEGAHVLELDIHATSDGVLVLMHDETVDRTTDGTGLIREMTFDALRQLDAGYDFTTDGATFPYRGQNLVVPRLEEVFDAYPDIPYVIEIKQASPSIVSGFVTMCRDRGLLENVVGASFDDGVQAELRAAAPEMLTSLALGEVFEFVTLQSDEEADYTAPGEFLQVPTEQDGLSVLDQALVEKAGREGLKVHAWTINDEAEMRSLLDLGVDGIITDYPGRLTSVLGE